VNDDLDVASVVPPPTYRPYWAQTLLSVNGDGASWRFPWLEISSYMWLRVQVL